MRKLAGGFAMLGLAIAACATSLQPVPIAAGDVCARCRRPITDVQLAAETISKGGLLEKYRTPGCLAKYLVDHPEDGELIFVTDYGTGKFVPVSAAIFVPTLNRDNGERDYIAFATKPAADAEAAKRQTSTVIWTDVLSQTSRERAGD